MTAKWDGKYRFTTITVVLKFFSSPNLAQLCVFCPSLCLCAIFFPFLTHFTAFCNTQPGINKLHLAPAKEENLSFDIFPLPCDIASLSALVKKES